MKTGENINAIIKILTEGELITLPKKKVDRWFTEAFKHVEEKEQYKIGVKLRDSQQRWKEQLENKNKNKK